MSSPSQLYRLKSDLQKVDGVIQSVEDGVGSFRNALSDIDKVLGYPKDIENDIDKLRKILAALYDVTEICSILPEVGTACGEMAKVLKRIAVSPKPPGGLLGEMKNTLHEIDKPIEALRKELGQIKKPVDDAWSALDNIRLDIARFQIGVDTLIEEHGDKPPKGVEDCAKALSDILEQGLGALNHAENLVTGQLNDVIHSVNEIEDVLNNLDSVKHGMEGVLDKVSGAAFNEMKGALDKMRAKVDELKHLAKWLFNKLVKKMGVNVGKLERGLAKAEGKIEGAITKAVNDVLSKAKNAVITELEKIPGVKELEGQVATLEQAAIQLRDKIENELGSACAKTLGGD
ncbi:MAG: hypothetical protein AAFV87_05470 [Pseudomonadota bacterium]